MPEKKVEEQTIELVKTKVDKKSIEDFLFTSETKLSEKQKTLFLQLAVRNQLDPFQREIYAVVYGQNFNVVTGYQVYIQRAEATGQLNGWHCEAIKNNGELTGAKITIYRKDFEHPFEWEVSLKEFIKTKEGTPISGWKTMPEFMIKKVCIGQGFRLAFPGEVGGLPYLQEEIEGIEEKKEETSKLKLIAHVEDEKLVDDSKETVKKPDTKPITPLIIPSAPSKKAMTPKEYMVYLLKAIKKENSDFYNNTIQALVDTYKESFPDNLPDVEYSKIVAQLRPYVKTK